MTVFAVECATAFGVEGAAASAVEWAAASAVERAAAFAVNGMLHLLHGWWHLMLDVMYVLHGLGLIS